MWPTSPVARKAHIALLQLARAQCIDDPAFLGLLGALLLDDGDAAQALIWLERSLLLDPGNLGIQADHAIALAELGEPQALQEMTRSWRARSDIPPALRARLFPSEQRSAFALPAARLGQPGRRVWAVQGELSLALGHETNLDRSPRLTELTLTIPDGPLVLPVISQPRTGAATLGSASIQVVYAPDRATVVRSGLNLTARAAPTDRVTDWQQVQWATTAVHQWSSWRGQVEAGASWILGPLGEPYQLARLGLSGDTALWDCRARIGYEAEERRQSSTRNFDSLASGWLTSLQCPLPAAGWGLSLVVRAGDDKPKSADRPGGEQQISSAGLRLVGALGSDTRLELSVRRSTVRDDTGYSALLDNNAVRRLSLQQASAEISRPMNVLGLRGLEATLQWQAAKQTSNLALFVYRADSIYGGVRWSW